MTYTKSDAWIEANSRRAKKDRNAEICRLRFEELMTLEEIGSKFGVTRERVRQITATDGREFPGAISERTKRIAAQKIADPMLSMAELGRQFGTSSTSVMYALNKMGIDRSVPKDKKFWKRVTEEQGDECRLWTGSRLPSGYGTVHFRGKYMYAHRVAFELTNGPVPDGLWVLHKCDNPPCCNPAHLFLGTPLDNVQDSIKKGRRQKSGWQRGEKSGNAKLTESQVLEIKQALAKGVRPKDLVPLYPVGLPGIYSIKAGYAWAWLKI